MPGVFGEGTPFEGLAPESEESGAEIFGAGTDFEGLEPEGEPAAAPAEPEKEEAGYLDQLRAGYYELRQNLAKFGAVEKIDKARQNEETGNVPRRAGSIKGEPQFVNEAAGSQQRVATEDEREGFSGKQYFEATRDLDKAAKFGAKAVEIPFSEETLDFLDESRGVPAGEAFRRAPFKIIAEIGLRSGVNSVPVLAGAALGGAVAGPAGAAAGAGVASARLEYVNSLIDGLQKEGVDTTDVDALREAVGNPELMRRVDSRAGKRGLAIGAFDSATMGAARVGLAPFKNTAARVGGNLVAQGAVQAAGGAAGEKTAQLLTGERDDRAVYAEAAGELVTAPVDVATATSKLVRGEQKPDAGPSPLEDMEAAQAAARDTVRNAGGDMLEQELAAAQVQAEATAELAQRMGVAKQTEAARQQILENVEREYSIGTAQQEENAARDLAQAKAQTKYEKYLADQQREAEAAAQPSPAEVDTIQQAEQRIQEELQGGQATRDAAFDALQQPANKAAAFEQAEAAPAADVARAEAQRQEQLGQQPAVDTPAPRSLAATTTIEEANPEVFKTLQERRAAGAFPAASVAAPAAAPKPATPVAATETPVTPPKTVMERRAREKKQPPAPPADAAPVTPAPAPKGPAPTTSSAAPPPGPVPGFSRTPRTLLERRAQAAAPAVKPAAVPTSDVRTKAEQRTRDGGVFTSDTTVPAETVREFRALEKQGFEVKRNPASRGKDGTLTSDVANTPVFEVRRKAQSKPAPAAKPKQKFITRGGRVIEENEANAAADELEGKQRGRRSPAPAAKKEPAPRNNRQDEQRRQEFIKAFGFDPTTMEDAKPAKTTQREAAAGKPTAARKPKLSRKDVAALDDELKATGNPDVRDARVSVRRAFFTEQASAIEDLKAAEASLRSKGLGTLANKVKAVIDDASSNLDLRDSSSKAPMGWDVAGDRDVKRTSIESARRQLKEFFAEYGNVVELVATVNDLPIEIQNGIARIDRDGTARTNIRGIHNPDNGAIYVIAENHTEETNTVLQTAVHEFLAHKGLRSLLTGPQREKLFLDVFKNATDRAWILDYAKSHGWDLRNREYQIRVADEYIAYLSENLDFQDASLLQRIFDELRAVFRKLGIVKEYTNDDLRRLLRMSQANARAVARANAEARPNLFGPELEFAADFRTAPGDRASPAGQLNALGQTFEDQANYNPGTITSRVSALKDFGQKRIGTLLGAIPRRNLVDFIAKGKMDSTRRYLSLADRMDGRRNELMAETEKTAKRWLTYVKQNRQNARILGELMSASTLAGVDPTETYVSSLASKSAGRISPEARQREAERRAAYDALKKYASRLDPEGLALYKAVRDSYVSDRTRIMAGIEERINSSQADGKTKRELLDTLRKQFEAGKVAGPYFPLARFGDYWAVAKDANGNVVSYIRRENPSEVKQWRAQMDAAGLKTDGGMKAANTSAGLAKQVDAGFVAKVTDLVKDLDQDSADQIWQMYLQTLPETSLRKQFTHRKGRLGYTADMLRAFGHQKFHAAHQISKLEFMHRMETELETMAVEARKLEAANDEEAKWATPVYNEFKQRHEWARNPTNAAWANNLTALGFAYYLGSSPAAALINFSQTAIVALPTIGAEFGMAKTAAALTRSAAQWAGSRGPLANRLRGDERLAFDEALRIGLFSQTRTTDLAELGSAGENVGSAREMAMKVITWLFQKTEQANREITFLAAFRLAKQAGLSQEEAIERAENLTWDSHFQYQSSNRPRAMQGNVQKVAFLFRQYSVNMTYRLARDFNNSLPSSMPAEEKAKARKRLAGLLTMTFLNAGVSGMPLVWLGYTVIGAMLGTDDEPYDAEASLRAWMDESLGETAGQAIMDGSLAKASGATLSTRVGLGSLWLQEKPTGMNATDEYGWWLSQAAGPIGGLVFKGFKANELAEQDYGDRALEQASPKAVTDVLKLMRYVREGVTNKRGDVLIDREQLSNKDLFLQAMGFVPLEITQQYEKNRAIKGEETKIMQRRATLMNRLFLAAQNEDPAMVQETIAMMKTFSEKNPTVKIDASAVISSARQRARYSQETINGIRVEPKLRYLQRKYGNEEK